jgi:hypothetical protein
MFWYIIGYIAIGFIGGSLYWGMFNEERYSHYYNSWENTEDGGVVILLSIIWPLTLMVLLTFGIINLLIKIFELIVNFGYNITH